MFLYASITSFYRFYIGFYRSGLCPSGPLLSGPYLSGPCQFGLIYLDSVGLESVGSPGWARHWGISKCQSGILRRVAK